MRVPHDDVQATAVSNGPITEPFKLGGEFMRPSCHIVFHVPNKCRKELPADVHLVYPRIKTQFHLSRHGSKTKTIRTSVVDLQYAADRAVYPHWGTELQTIFNIFIGAFETMCLTTNISKTKLPHHHNLGAPLAPPAIIIPGELLEYTEDLLCLGRNIWSKATLRRRPNWWHTWQCWSPGCCINPRVTQAAEDT